MKYSEIKSLEIKDMIITKNLDSTDIMSMFKGIKLPPGKQGVPIIPLFGDQELTTLSDEELEVLGLMRTNK